MSRPLPPLTIPPCNRSVSNPIIDSHVGLPPKSPSSSLGSSTLGKIIFVPNRSNSQKKTKRRGSKSRRNGRERSIHNPHTEKNDQLTTERDECSSSSSRNGFEDQIYRRGQSLVDPSPSPLSVAEDQDDLCSTAGLNMVSFESSNSPTSVLDLSKNGEIRGSYKRRVKDHRAKSWHAGNSSSVQNSSSKTCLQVPSIFRRQKIMCADVASVGSASDTVVTVGNSGGRISGRELHEKAKEVLNDGDYPQALTMFEAIRVAQIDRFGECHSSVGAATHNVGVVRLRMGQVKRAAVTLERAVEIRRRVLGDSHLELAASLAKLGSARALLHKFDSGLQVLRESLGISRRMLGRSHRGVAQILCHIACLYFEASELYSAQATFEDALDIYREILPTEVDRDACLAQLTETLCNIGSIQNKRKNFKSAIESFKEALEIQRALLGDHHPRVIASLDNLGFAYSKNKSYNRALACYNEMQTSQLINYGSFSDQNCETLKKQVLICVKLKKLDVAIKISRKALKKIRKNKTVAESHIVNEVELLLAELKEKRDTGN